MKSDYQRSMYYENPINIKYNIQRKSNNYAKIDEYILRSAQPQKEDFTQLKEQGVTDVINFRTMYAPAVDFEVQVDEIHAETLFMIDSSRHAHESGLFDEVINWSNKTF